MTPAAQDHKKRGSERLQERVVERRVMRTVAKNRVAASAIVAGATWAFGHFHAPFPSTNDVVVLVANSAPHVVAVVRLPYTVMWFATPFIVSSVLLSYGYIFFVKPDKGRRASPCRAPPQSTGAAIYSSSSVRSTRHARRSPSNDRAGSPSPAARCLPGSASSAPSARARRVAACGRNASLDGKRVAPDWALSLGGTPASE